jgi:hypothetical protein
MPRGQSYKDVHVDRSLTNLSIAHWQSTDMFVAGRFFSNLPVMHASDTYTTYPQGYFNRIHDTKRAEEGVANSIQYKSKEETYSCGEDALRIYISDKKRANADPHRNLDFEATEAVTNALLLGKEKDFANKFLLSSSGWTISRAGVASGPSGNQTLKWDVAGADPVQQVLDDHVNMVINGGGRRPNKGLMSLDLYMVLRERADLIERVVNGGNNTQPAKLTVQAIASLFELDELMIMQTVINTAVDGIEDPSTGLPPVSNEFLASGVFLLAHVPPGAGLYTATAGLTFVWNQYIAMGVNAGPAIRRYRPQTGVKGEYIEAELSIDQKMVSADLGILYYDMLT